MNKLFFSFSVIISFLIIAPFVSAGDLRYLLLSSSKTREFLEVSEKKSFITVTKDKAKKKEIDFRVGEKIFDKFYAIPELSKFLVIGNVTISTKDSHVVMLTDQRRSHRAIGAIYVFNREENRNNRQLQDFLRLLKGLPDH